VAFGNFLRSLFARGTAPSAGSTGPAPAGGSSGGATASPAPAPVTPAPTAAPSGAGGTGGSVSSGSGFGGLDMERIHGAYTSGHSGTRERMSPEEEARMIDRRRAQTELAGRFQIVPADFIGPRLPNQVTQAEFEHLANNYSDIRTGHSNIHLDSAGMNPAQAAAFQSGAMTDIASMLQTSAGRSLVDQLSTAHAADGTARTTTIRGIANPLGSNAAALDPARAADRGNGVGTNMVVSYAPGRDAVVPGAGNPWLPIRSDVALLHEMTHALHGVQGQRLGSPVAAADAQPGDQAAARAGRITQEEYATVGLGRFAPGPGGVSENAYRAERRMLAGRAGARAGDELPSMQARTNYVPG